MEPGLRQLAVQRVSEWVPLPALARPTVLPGAGPGGVTRSQPEMRHVHIAGPGQPVRYRQRALAASTRRYRPPSPNASATAVIPAVSAKGTLKITSSAPTSM